MIEKINLESILFLDIETVPEQKEFNELSSVKQALYEAKTAYQRKEEVSAEDFYERAGIWAEFGKIVCISVGYINYKGNERKLRIKSFYGDEKSLLIEFKQLLESHFNTTKQMLCAHNGKEFDFPYIARRMLIQGISLPNLLQLFGKKPWEVPHLDTMELWKFGDYKHYTSLKLLTEVFGIPSPKNDIDGSQVRSVYYEERDIDRIISYCEKDVIAIVQLFLRFRQEEVLSDDEILIVG